MTTALAYQMMIERELLVAMISGESRGLFTIASHYAYTYCVFLGIDKDKNMKIPDKPFNKTDPTSSQISAWENYYFSLLLLIARKANQTLEDVRIKYNHEKSKIPK